MMGTDLEAGHGYPEALMVIQLLISNVIYFPKRSLGASQSYEGTSLTWWADFSVKEVSRIAS